MYQHQIQALKQQLLQNPVFDCILTGSSNGIRILSVVKLSNEINQNNHNVFCDLDDYRGLNYWIVGVNKNYFFEKPKDEVGCDTPLYGDNNFIRILGIDGRYSQLIGGLSANHTIYGHSSYLVLATLENEVSEPVEPTKLKQDLIDLRERLNHIIEELS